MEREQLGQMKVRY